MIAGPLTGSAEITSSVTTAGKVVGSALPTAASAQDPVKS